jgi:hypothetical protein
MDDYITEDLLKLLGFVCIDDKQRLWQHRHNATGVTAKWSRTNTLHGKTFDVWEFASGGEEPTGRDGRQFLDSPTEIMGFMLRLGSRKGRRDLVDEFKALMRQE